jgi:uncharacterized hydrophobic protein (TIGR00271 family)
VNKTFDWIKHLVRPLPKEQRRNVINELTPLASPGFDFFLLVVLSCSIATLGLITDSPAVIIGAMLLAPLMSPIIGIGLASITGDSKLLTNSLTALLRGALLAVLLAIVVTFINSHLPFVSLQELPQEILARTRPSPIDLMIALAGGLAAAYALTQPNLSAALPGVAIATALMPPLCTIGIGIAVGRWDVAGGASLLFLTNAITIAFAAVLVFFLRGFGASTPGENNHRLPRSLLLSALLTVSLLLPLSYYSIRFVREAAENRKIQTVVSSEVRNNLQADLMEMDLKRNDSGLEMTLTLRTSYPLQYQQVVNLQEAIVNGINKPVSLKVNQILAEELDPLIPPTPTATPTITSTSTPGPSPTASNTPTATNTFTPSATYLPTYTNTPSPTFTQTPTLTPAQAEVSVNRLPKMMIYQNPGGPAIGTLYTGQKIEYLYHSSVEDGLVWVEIRDEEGRVGWILEIYMHLIQPSPTPTIISPTNTPTPMNTPN